MNRKEFLNKTFISAVVLINQNSILGEGLLDSDAKSKLLSAKTLEELKLQLIQNQSLILSLEQSGQWPIGKVLSHCAQSIEYSLDGFPESKSVIFQNTIGSLAFGIFSIRGKMNHGLTEPIPGASELLDEPSLGMKRLIVALEKFEKVNSDILKPHFAYGKLDKADYAMAHKMHIQNHLEAF